MATAEDTSSDDDPSTSVYPGDYVLVTENGGENVWPGEVVDAKFGESATEAIYLVSRYKDGEPTGAFYRAPNYEVALHPTGRLGQTVVEELNDDERRDT